MQNQAKTKIQFPFWEWLITCGIGVLFHFVFEWSGGNTIIGAFAPVNESTWEHMKLVLFPALIVSIIAYFIYGKNQQAFIPARIIGILSGTLLIPLIFYFLCGAFGEPSAVINIIIYCSAVFFAFFIYRIVMVHDSYFTSDNATVAWVLILAVVIILFVYFTYQTPMAEIFRDPLSLDFGIISGN